jgi:hypothetical protein
MALSSLDSRSAMRVQTPTRATRCPECDASDLLRIDLFGDDRRIFPWIGPYLSTATRVGLPDRLTKPLVSDRDDGLLALLAPSTRLRGRFMRSPSKD